MIEVSANAKGRKNVIVKKGQSVMVRAADGVVYSMNDAKERDISVSCPSTCMVFVGTLEELGEKMTLEDRPDPTLAVKAKITGRKIAATPAATP